MSMLNELEAKKLINTVLSFSKADETRVTVRGNRTGNIRYARNTVSTTGDSSNMTISVVSVFGKKIGMATTNEQDMNSLKETVRISEDIARLAPENPEFMPGPASGNYESSPTFSANTEKTDPFFRAEAALASIQSAIKNDCTAAGYLEDTTSFIAIGNTKGLFAYNKETSGDFTVTVRTPDEKGSGYSRQSFTDVSKLNTTAATTIAIRKAKASANVRELQPGKYTVILEPIAVADLIPMVVSAMDARNADEGRSYFGKRGSGNRIGEKIFDQKVTIYSDPFNPESPTVPFTSEGIPQRKVMWIENGIIKNLSYSQYWAAQKGVSPVPSAQGIIMPGTDITIEEMIKNTGKGLLVSHFWYIRPVNSQQLLYTGLTRDGVFYIENGEIKYPVKNFRFNESPANMLINLEQLGRTERVGRDIVPAMKVKDFNFSSISDAV